MTPYAQVVEEPVADCGDQSDRELRILSRQECLEFLGLQRLGRLAFTAGGRAKIFPVNYLFDGNGVVVRTGPGFKLTKAPMQNVAFEIDAAAADGAWGWSVVVEGACFNVTNALDELSTKERELPAHAWAPGEREKWLRIDLARISGRAFGVLPDEVAGYRD